MKTRGLLYRVLTAAALSTLLFHLSPPVCSLAQGQPLVPMRSQYKDDHILLTPGAQHGDGGGEDQEQVQIAQSPVYKLYMPVLFSAGTYYVAPYGDDANPGTRVEPWATVRKAIATAIAGDTVVFANGIYDIGGGVDLVNSGSPNAPITFRAANPRGVVWQLTVNGQAVDAADVAHIRFQGLVIRGDRDFRSSNLVRLSSVDHITFKNCELTETTGRGIGMWGGCTNVVIDSCTIHPEDVTSQYDGIYLYGAGNANITVRNTEVYHTAHVGIGVKGVDGLLIKNCHVHHTASHGISLNSSGSPEGPRNVVVQDSRVHDVEEWGSGSGSPHCGVRIAEEAENVHVFGNDIYNCDARGVEIWSNATGPIEIRHNTLFNNNLGGYDEGSIQCYDTPLSDAPPSSIYIANNIIYHTRGENDKVAYFSSDISRQSLTTGANLWYSASASEAIRRDGVTYNRFGDYGAAYEQQSVFGVEPMFVDARAGDFTLMPNSPVAGLGFGAH